MNLKKFTLNINGADRMFICDPEKDTLAGVLRRLGLTGTKVGCGTGVCGACSVILDGKVIRSCTKKMKTVKEYSSVTTIEGIGTVSNPHPLQYAWVHLGAVQCGFCVPGFIVSAYGLLQQNPNPTREDVRDWFQKHRNVCRCTGYKQIVDAVMEAAAIMRGDKTFEDITYDYKQDVGDFYGKPLVRPNAMPKACGVCDYGDDIELKMPAETLKVVPVMPRITNHAKILNIDYSEAEKMPGVVKVITAKDIEGANHLMMFQFTPRTTAFDQVHKLLYDDKIVSYGNAVALVAADTKEHAKAAALKVKVEIEQLPEYMSYLEAVTPDAQRIYPNMDNIYSYQPLLKGDSEKVPEMIDDAEYVVEGSFYSSREPHMSIEGDTIQAYYDEDGKLCVHCKTMTLYFDRDDIAEATGLPVEDIRVIENPTGGSFGWAMSASSYSLAAIACKVLQKPVALSMDYSQFMAYSGKRSPAYLNGRLACDKDGMIIAGEFDSGLDHGFDPALGDDKLSKIVRFMFFPYYVPNAAGLARAAVTNHAFGTAYRGYGAPQAYTCGEALIDMMAEKIGMDPFEFRYKNIARKGQTNLNSAEFLQYPMEEMMDKMKPLYEKAVAEAKAKDTPEVRRGVGLAWGGYNVGLGSDDFAGVALELVGDRKFIKYDTWQDQGQGGDQGSLICTLEALKPYFPDVLPEDVKLIQDDSKYCPNTGESAGSRSHFANGKASILAAKNLADAMRKEDGTYRTYDEMIAEGIPTRYEGNWEAKNEWEEFQFLDPNTGVGSPTYAYTYALFMSEVEVEVATGKTTVIGMTCVDWVGKIGNIQAVDGQAYGGISHAIGFALSENYEDVKKHTNMYTAGVPYIKDVPDDMTLIHLDGYDERGPFGSSGASEAFQSSDHVAVINAINNACGVRIYEIPATPAKVKAGIDLLAAGGKIEPPKKYFLGSDLYDELDKIKANPVSY
ncbi:molybdopterin-dependent oxidoreductase [Anaerovorax odorimutans]|uniref:molybdopterin-dependent oxidoreductase n=1 Tax=Anaerovorax odorimutans TaxID=109327 RepID=UPI00041EDFF7|nr:molybdopterin cofactor-binding domain-containing protein [Anaerovorax odorimutans]